MAPTPSSTTTTQPPPPPTAANTSTVEVRCLQVMSQMQHRGLHSSAAWLGEMLHSATPDLLQTRFTCPKPPLVEQDTVAVKIGESYIANQEYRRCTNLLSNEPGFRASFLGLYALYLDGEKQKDVAGAADFAATERAAALAGGGGGTFASDTGNTAHGGSSAGGASIHADVPSGLRRNHHAVDLDRALTALVSFNLQPQQQHQHHDDGEEGSSSSIHHHDDDDDNNNSPQLMREYSADHAYLHWLHGVVRRERGFRAEAATSFLFALSLEPLLWSAWVDLAGVVSTEAEVNGAVAAIFHSGRPQGFNAALGWIGLCFSALAKSEMQLLAPALGEYEQLIGGWNGVAPPNSTGATQQQQQQQGSPRSNTSAGGGGGGGHPPFRTSAYLLSRLGCVHYHRKDHAASREAFEAAIACDPLRLDGLDDFSNLLFVAGDKRRLAALAQTTHGVDPFRAETACIAGNYFAMLRRHAQSVQHFRRAVTMNRKSSGAWTLLGHGYVEVKHTSAAVDAYSTAVEVDRRDYRAWYGLGQIFELLHLYPQALDFYRQTAAVRPHDSRMWSVVANCLERQQRFGEAVRCLERAEACEPSSTDFYCNIVRKLAEHYSGQHRPAGTLAGSTAAAAGGGGENSSSNNNNNGGGGLQQNPDHIHKAVAFYTKLLHSGHSSSEDRVTALLYLIAAGLFEAFDLLDLMPRQHSMIASLQQQQVPLSTSGVASSNKSSTNNNNDDESASVSQRLSSQLDGGLASVSRNNNSSGNSLQLNQNVILPQPTASLHFGRTQPRQIGGTSSVGAGRNEARKARAATVVEDAETMLLHLNDELSRGFDVAGAVGGGVGAALMMHIPQQLETWLKAYQHDLDFLKQYF